MFQRQPRYSMEEFETRGTELYETKIRSQVEAGNDGRLLCIDIESGEFALGDQGHETAQVLSDKNPDCHVGLHPVAFPSPPAYDAFCHRVARIHLTLTENLS